MSADSTDSPRPLGEISQAPAKFEQFLDRNQKSLVVFALLLAVGAAGLVVYRGVQQGQEESAGAALSSAGDLSSLQSILREFPDSTAAGSARVLLADQQWEEGQQDAAIETLRSFLSSNPKHPARHTARASLGSKLFSQGKNPEAREVFNALVADEGGRFLAPYALISLGDIARAEGDVAAAQAFYQQANSDYPANSFNQIASTRLAVSKASPPVEIDPPPAPEPAPEMESQVDPLTPPPFLARPTSNPTPQPTFPTIEPAEQGTTPETTPVETPEVPEGEPMPESTDAPDEESGADASEQAPPGDEPAADESPAEPTEPSAEPSSEPSSETESSEPSEP
jgi:predicted negative regulator of RcsB-dependent stress response